MTVLAIVFAVGLALSVLPWRPVAWGVAGCVSLGVLTYVFGPANVFLPLTMLAAPALLLGWAMGLLIRRTIAERRAQ